jgi:UDP-N-acetyl-D-mannosaminuronate dehydrogenase
VELVQGITNGMSTYQVLRAAGLLNSHRKPRLQSHASLLGVIYEKDSTDLRAARGSSRLHIASQVRTPFE